MFESCLRNSQKPEVFRASFVCCGKTPHMLPVAVLRKAKRPFGPSASPASATREAASALYKGFAASSGKNTRRGGKIKLSNKVIS